MRTYVTEIKAIDPLDGELKRWGGLDIIADSFEDAERYCQENGLGYLEVTGELVGRIDADYEGDLTEDRLTKSNDYINLN